jgi:hypothetical protein
MIDDTGARRTAFFLGRFQLGLGFWGSTKSGQCNLRHGL